MPDLATSPEPLSDVDRLIAHARQGSNEALGKALNACRNYLLMVANRNFPPMLRPEEGPSDLVQKTITKGMENFAQFSGDTKAALLAWLKGILFNLTANELKRKKRQPPQESLGCPGMTDPVAGKERSPLEVMIARVNRAGLMAALAKLSEEYQQVIHLRVWERLSFQEIAARMGKPSAGAVGKLWARAIVRLSELMGLDDAQQ